MNIITVSREFGSGGRELGKRLADALGYAYYDKEILSVVSSNLKSDETYVSRKLDAAALHSIPLTYGRTIGRTRLSMETAQIMAEQHKVIREIARKGENFVIVGRNADVVLKDYHPVNLFVYADMDAKIRRSMSRKENDISSEKEMAKLIAQIDKGRKKSRELLTNLAWGEKANYHLCINTSDVEIKKMVAPVAELVKTFIGGME